MKATNKVLLLDVVCILIGELRRPQHRGVSQRSEIETTDGARTSQVYFGSSCAGELTSTGSGAT